MQGSIIRGLAYGFSWPGVQDSWNPRAFDRATSKVRNSERGRGGVERRLVALGARPHEAGEPGRAWLEEALHAVGARVSHHGGHHRYAAYIGPRTGRRLTATSRSSPSSTPPRWL
ncbi:hypothetical protein [Streptomyces sp. 2A115]|uniref:hypothetical protein n=1 Tax=Streptomyces sp. 2A115 TaxID=3457439 RepID=UPI003FD6AF79